MTIDTSTITPPCIIWTGRSGTYFCIFSLMRRSSSGSFMVMGLNYLYDRLCGAAAQGGSQMRRHHLQQQRVDIGITRADVAGLEVGVRAVQVADHAARFGNQQAACGHVPRL